MRRLVSSPRRAGRRRRRVALRRLARRRTRRWSRRRAASAPAGPSGWPSACRARWARRLASLGRRRTRSASEAETSCAAWAAVERLDLPVPARMRDLEQRLADVLGGDRARSRRDRCCRTRTTVSSTPMRRSKLGLDLLAVERIDDGARDRQHQQVQAAAVANSRNASELVVIALLRQPVAEAADGLDHVGRDLLAQPADEHLDGVGVAVEVLLVEVLDQLGARHHAPLWCIR